MFSLRQAKGSAFHDDMLGRIGNRRFPRIVFGAAWNKLAARLSTGSLYVYYRCDIYVQWNSYMVLLMTRYMYSEKNI
jgi:hypothetical protein